MKILPRTPPRPQLRECLDTHALWSEAEAAKLLQADSRVKASPLSAERRADLVSLVEGLQQCGLRFGVTQAAVMGIPRGLLAVSPETVADMLSQQPPSKGALMIQGQDIVGAPVTSLRDLRILDAFYGTGNRDGFAHAPLAAALDHLMACGLSFALGRSDRTPAAVSVYEACRRYEGDHSDHDYSCLYFIGRDSGQVVGKEFYDKSVAVAAFFEHGAAPEVLGKNAKAGRVMRELAYRGAIFHRTMHSWEKEAAARVVSPRQAWEELTSYEPGNVYVSMPGHGQLASFRLGNPELYIHALVIEPMVRNGSMQPKEAHELLASFSDASLPPDQGGRLVGDLLHKIQTAPRRAWVFSTDHYRMAAWGCEVTAAALQQAPALAEHLDAWLDFVVAVGPYDAREKFPAMHERASGAASDWHTEMALQIAEATLGRAPFLHADVEDHGPHETFESARKCWEREQAQPLLARLLERRLAASDRILRAVDDFECIRKQQLPGESLAAAGERFQQVETLMRRYPEDDVRASFITATRGVGQRTWDDCMQDITRDVSLGSGAHVVRRNLEREGAAPTMRVGDTELVINGVRLRRRS